MAPVNDANKQEQKETIRREKSSVKTAKRETPRTPKPVDTDSFLKFLDKKTTNIVEPFHLKKVFDEYCETDGRSVGASRHFYRVLRSLAPKIPDNPNYDDDAKVRILFATSSVVCDEFLKRLRVKAVVEVDEFNRITKYESPQGGGLRIQGKHKNGGIPSDKKSSRATPRCKSAISTPRGKRGITKKTGSEKRREPYIDDGTDESIMDDYHGNIGQETVVMAPAESDSDIQFLESVPAKPGNRGMQFFGRIKQEPMDFEQRFDHREFSNSCEIMNYPTNIFSSSNFNNNNYIGFQENSGILNGVSNLMMSMTGFFQSQTNLIREMTRISTGSPTTSSTSASNPINAENKTISLRDFLKHIQRYLVHLDTMSLASVNHQIIVELQNIGIVDKMIQMSKMKSALESTLALVGPHCTGVSHMESTNSKDFLKHIYMYSCTFEQLHEIRDQFKQKIDSIHDLHMIPLAKLRSALEAAIGIVVY